MSEIENVHDIDKNLHEITKEIKNKLTFSFLSLLDAMEDLKKVKDTKKYKEVYKTFDDYIAEEFPEFKRSTIYKYLLIYDKYGRALDKIISVNPYKNLSFPIERLYQAKDVVTNAETAERVIEWALLCNTNDFRDNIRELKGLIASDQCLHETTELWEKCTDKCKAWLGKVSR